MELREGLRLKPEWTKPDLSEEGPEIYRTAMDLDIDYPTLLGAAKDGVLEDLTEEDWSDMLNCDSNDSTWTINQVVEWLNSRQVDGEDHTRDIDKLISGYESGNRLPAPIVLFRNNAKPYLIAGNSRLLVARAKGDIPRVLAVRLDKGEKITTDAKHSTKGDTTLKPQC